MKNAKRLPSLMMIPCWLTTAIVAQIYSKEPINRVALLSFTTFLLFASLFARPLVAQKFSIEEDYWKNSREVVSRKANFKATFPGPTKTSNQTDGRGKVTWDGDPDWCAISYQNLTEKVKRRIKSGELTPTKMFEDYQKENTEISNGKLLEASPIRWKGHHGHEFALAYDFKRTKRVVRIRRLLVEDTVYDLVMDFRIFLNSPDLNWLRQKGRKKAIRFFDSMELTRTVKPTAFRVPNTIAGRWVQQSSSEKGNDSKKPLEHLFLNGAYFTADVGEFGSAISTSFEWKYKVDKSDPQLIALELSIPGAPQTLKQYARYKFDGDILLLEFGEKPFKNFSKDAMKLKRPGAEYRKAGPAKPAAK